jgi:hypothetical protein
MKLRSKILAGFAATVLALTMMVGTAFAATSLYVYGNEAGAKEDSKDLVICELLSGGGNQDGFNGPVYDELQALYADIASVDCLLTGNFTGTAHLNLVGDLEFTPNGSGYDNQTYANKDITVDGYLVYSGDFGPITSDARFAFLLRNKSEGAAVLEGYVFRNADGDIIAGMDGSGYLDAAAAQALYEAVTSGVAEEAPVTEAPKTGVVSAALLLGVGAVASALGTVVLKKKER